jgi:protein involved in polysaccharide export with SLBB domain
MAAQSRTPRKTLFLLSFVLTLSACSSKKERPEFPYSEQDASVGVSTKKSIFDASKEDPSTGLDPIVQPGFTIEISNIEDRRLNGKFKVDFDGQLRMPYAVNIDTSNLHLSEVRAKLEASYRKFFQGQSTFSIVLVKRDYLVEARGLVTKPGRISIEPHASLEAVITKAGGLSKDVVPKYLRVVRRDKTEWALPIDDYFKGGSQFTNLEIRAGDTLYFQVDSPDSAVSMVNLTTLQIYGEVTKPGTLTYHAGQDIYDYLLQAGGPAPMADLSHVRIVRGPSQDRALASLDLMDEEKRPSLRPGDVIIVPYDKPTPIEKKISSASAIATIITAFAILIIGIK